MEDESEKRGQGTTCNIKSGVKGGGWRKTRQSGKESLRATKTKL